MARIRIRKQADVLYNLVVILLTAGIIFLSYRLISNNFFGKEKEYIEGVEALSNQPRRVVTERADFFSEFWTRIRKLDLTDPAFILSSQMPYLAAGQGEMTNPSLEAKDVATSPVMSSSRGLSPRQDEQRSNAGENGNGEHAYGESDGKEGELSDEIKIQISTISDTLPPVSLTGEGPQILIYHTHSLEAYRQDPNNQYKAIAAFRSSDFNHTVMSVGDVLTKNLQQKGISVIHDRTNHEQYTWKDGLYPRSLETIKKNIEKYSSIKIFLDIHRNYNASLNDPDKEVVIINGQRVAKFFMLIGTGEGVSGGFKEKPNWRENYQFALKLTNKANEKYPGLAGDIKVQTGRYNQHVSTKAILIEIGNHLTTLEEAKRTAAYLAEIISESIEK